jgi:curli production assembly/transport component CsgE
MGSRVSLFCLFFLVAFSFHLSAQDIDDGGVEETTAVLTERTLTEEIPTSLILDNTRTKVGRDFYESFFREWSEMTADTALTAQFMVGLDPEDFIISIDEMPSSGTGTIVSVTVNDLLIWQQFLQPRGDVFLAAVADGTLTVRSYFENYQAIQAEFQSKDMSGTGVY